MTRPERSPQETLDRFRPDAAWGTWFPSGEAAWDRAAAAHLLRRSGFGHAPGDLDRLVALGPRDALGSLLAPDADAVVRFNAAADELDAAASATGRFDALAAAWTYRMLRSPDPLREKMTLFWHGHFATSGAKVTDARLMADQITLFRRHALGRFGDLLAATATDPAMLLWLDGDRNRAGAANENLARELFELFALGPGNYSEADVKEAARALTGWTVTDATDGRRAVFDPSRHDGGNKTIFGVTGRFGMGEVVRLTLSHPACGLFLVRKLFRFFISETAEPSDARSWRRWRRGGDCGITICGGCCRRCWDRGRFTPPRPCGSGSSRPWSSASGSLAGWAAESARSTWQGPRRRWGNDCSSRRTCPAGLAGRRGSTSAALIDRQNLIVDAASGTGRTARLDPARLAEERGLNEPAAIARFFLDHFLQEPDHAAAGPLIDALNRLAAEADRFTPPRLTAARLARRAAETAARLPEYQLA